MKNLPWQKRKEFFTEEQNQRLVDAIKMAEKETSGEIRLYVESKSPAKEPVNRAKELFLKLKMDKSELHNATLIYVAVKHEAVSKGQLLFYFQKNRLLYAQCYCIN